MSRVYDVRDIVLSPCEADHVMRDIENDSIAKVRQRVIKIQQEGGAWARFCDELFGGPSVALHTAVDAIARELRMCWLVRVQHRRGGVKVSWKKGPPTLIDRLLGWR